MSLDRQLGMCMKEKIANSSYFDGAEALKMEHITM